MPPTDSTRFLIQMVVNIVICKYAKQKIAKIATKKEGKKALKGYLALFLFALLLIGLNQALFFLFKPLNLYQELNITRSMPPDQIKLYEEDLKIKIMQMDSMPIQQRMSNIERVHSMVQILTHPARRLSYDTFGETDTSFAWAFKNHYFLLSTIIGASIFYIMCTFINMVSDKRNEIKAVFKLEIMVMILLFLWEVELIMKTETRIHQHTDSLDTVYTAFPMFERRDMIKIILIPCMNIIKFFYRFYVLSEAEKKVLIIGNNPHVRALTLKTSEAVSKLQLNHNAEDKINVTMTEMRRTEGDKTDIFVYQARALSHLINLEIENILVDEDVKKVLSYFGLVADKQKQKKQ